MSSQHEIILNFLEKNQINLINCYIITLLVLFVIFDILLNNNRPHLPSLLWLSGYYGKLNHKVEQITDSQKLKVPKSWFGHFYVFAFALSLLAVGFTLKGITTSSQAPDCIVDLLDYVAGGKARKVYVNSTIGLVTIVMITMQCGHRFYESNFVQIFSKKGKMNLVLYISTFLIYFSIVMALLANTEGFVRGTTPSPFSLTKISLMQYLCCFIFYFSWSQQYSSNMILVNLRKDKKGNKVTESHLIPQGGFFEFVSSPHMLFEVCMYTAIYGIIPNSRTFLLITILIITNQTQFAWLTHKWYKDNFKDYPTTRYAIYPYIL